MLLALTAYMVCLPAQTFDGTSRTPAKLVFTQEVGSDENDVFILRPGQERERIFLGGTMPQWSPNGRYLAILANVGVWLYDERSRRAKEIIGFKASGFPTDYGWSPDGRYILYTHATGSDRPDYRLYAYDLATGKSRQLTRGGGNWSWDKAGRRMLVTTIYTGRRWDDFERGEGSEPSDVVMLDANLHLIRRVTRDAWNEAASWLPHNEVLLEHAGSEPADGAGHPTHFYVQNLTTGKRRHLNLPWDVEGYWKAVSPDGRTLAATADGHGQILYLADLATGRSKIVAKDIYPSQLAWSRDGRHLFFERTSPHPKQMYADSEQVFKLDVRTGKVEQISHQPEMYSFFGYDNSRGTVMFQDRGIIYQADGQGVVALGKPAGIAIGDIAAWWPRR
ncbi:MAG: TolB family protein [Fimbriimonadales bacterium]